MSIFKKASKDKLRFLTSDGVLTDEDLWDIPLESLDQLAISLKKSLADTENESFIGKKRGKNDTLQLRFDIAKSIIDERLADIDKQEKAQATRAKNQKIMELIVAKEDDKLNDNSIDELRAMLEED